MITPWRFAFRDIRKEPLLFAFFAFQMIVATFFLSIYMDRVISLARDIDQVSRFSQHDLTFFSPHLGTVSQRRITERAAELLREIFDLKRAGYSVIETITPEGYPDVKVVAGVGAWEEIFLQDISPPRNQDIAVFVGSRVKSIEVGDGVKFGKTRTVELNVSGRLPEGSVYFQGGSPLSLDHALLFLVDFQCLTETYYPAWYFWDEIIFNTVLVNPSGEELLEFITGIREETGLILNPFDQDYYHNNYRRFLSGARLSIIFFSVTTVFIFFGLLSNILLLLESNMREYAIHLLHGAGMPQLYSRIAIYVFLLVSIPLLAARVLNALLPSPLVPLPRLVPLIVFMALLLACIPMVQLKKSDLIFYLRSDG